MGRPKQSLRLDDGRTMIEAVASVMAGVCGQVVIVGDADGLPLLQRVADLRPNLGPLGGVEALLASGRGPAYLVCPCDLPLLQPRMLAALAAGAHEAAEHRALACVLRIKDRPKFETFPLVIHAASLPIVTSMLDRGELAMWKLLHLLEPEVVTVPADAEWSACLSNVNTPEDWERLRHNRD
jgi:molybdenum cofactor guanylyltransferase